MISKLINLRKQVTPTETDAPEVFTPTIDQLDLFFVATKRNIKLVVEGSNLVVIPSKGCAQVMSVAQQENMVARYNEWRAVEATVIDDMFAPAATPVKPTYI